jgi:hypothetical protein
MKNIGFGAYDGYRSVNRLADYQHEPSQMDGWFKDASSRMWTYFQPMIPWFIITNFVTAIIVWKLAKLACSGRLVLSDLRQSIKV